MKNVCTWLAEEGFVALAPDLYHGKIAREISDAENLARALDHVRARADLAEAAAYLCERAGEDDAGLAVIGFSLGAYFALDLSAADPDHVRSTVVFYGTGPADFTRSKSRYLGHFAETDEYEPRAEVDKLEAALVAAGRPVTFHHYPGTGHWFFETDRVEAFDQAAATLAWRRTLAFLRGE
jgi:carboxymethylenebutenolidase